MPEGMQALLVDHFIKFVGDAVPQALKDKTFQISAREPVTYETGRSTTAEFTAVTSGSNSGFKNLEVLEPDDWHLYGLDWGMKDNCRYYMKVPTGRDRLGLDEDMDVGFVKWEQSPWMAKDPRYGFWLVKEMYPAFDAYNDCPVSVTPKIYFEGFKYTFKSATPPPGRPAANITLGGVDG